MRSRSKGSRGKGKRRRQWQRKECRVGKASNGKASALILEPNGYIPGSDSLKGQILQAAGFLNVADQIGIEQYGQLDIEQLIALDMDYLIIDNTEQGGPSMAHRWFTHPVVSAGHRDVISVAVPGSYWICPSTFAYDVIKQLADARNAMGGE